MKCVIDGCYGESVARCWCNKHYLRWKRLGDPTFGRDKGPSGAGTFNGLGYRVFKVKGTFIYEHIMAAEKALGRPLQPGTEVHHVDENKSNNAGINLVICPNRAYHILMHTRNEALIACGNANWRRCNFCKQYDDPSNLRLGIRSSVHPKCANAYQRSRQQEKKSCHQITS